MQGHKPPHRSTDPSWEWLDPFYNDESPRTHEYQRRKLPPSVVGAARLSSDLGYGWFEAAIPGDRFLYLRACTGFCVSIDLSRDNVAIAYSVIAFARGCPPKSWALPEETEFVPSPMPWLEPPTCSRNTEISRKRRGTIKANKAAAAAAAKAELTEKDLET